MEQLASVHRKCTWAAGGLTALCALAAAAPASSATAGGLTLRADGAASRAVTICGARHRVLVSGGTRLTAIVRSSRASARRLEVARCVGTRWKTSRVVRLGK